MLVAGAVADYLRRGVGIVADLVMVTAMGWVVATVTRWVVVTAAG